VRRWVFSEIAANGFCVFFLCAFQVDLAFRVGGDSAGEARMSLGWSQVGLVVFQGGRRTMSKKMRMLPFQVVVWCERYTPDGKPLVWEQEVKSQNAVHAAASGLMLAGLDYVDQIKVTALQPIAGRSAFTIFRGCSRGVYGFCFQSCT
jgi:hypothetical protein